MPLFPEAPTRLNYVYSLEQTIGCTGYVSCSPEPRLSLQEGLNLLADRPHDTFLRQYLLRAVSNLDLSDVLFLCMKNSGSIKTPGLLASLLVEYAGGSGSRIFGARFETLLELAQSAEPLPTEPDTSAPHSQIEAWRDFFRANIHSHNLDARNLPPVSCLYPAESLAEVRDALDARAGVLAREKERIGHIEPQAPIEPRVTFERAIQALAKAGLLAGPEMRHEASLSPIALLREWRLDLEVKNGRLDYSLKGKATAYGRGLSLAGARAACAMEIVERASAHASAVEGGKWECGKVSGRRKDLSLRLASHEWLQQQGIAALDPTTLHCNAESRFAPLHWLEGEDSAGNAVLVPAQAVFLFCNLDEGDYIPSSSTGLASGNSMAQARLAALTEILERDAHATTPFNPEKCFRLIARDARMNSLLLDYRARNIHIRFEDISGEDGFPVFRCFVQSREGEVVQSTGAGLDARKALLSALTETPWPYVWAKPAPFGTPTSRAMEDLPARFLEDFPDFSLPSIEASLALVENMLKAEGRAPVYVDITRSDLDLPVTRAIIPGAIADTDSPGFPTAGMVARWQRQNSSGQ